MNVTICRINRCFSLVHNEIHIYFFVLKRYSQQSQSSIFRIKKLTLASKIFNQTRCIIVICKIHALKMYRTHLLYEKSFFFKEVTNRVIHKTNIPIYRKIRITTSIENKPHLPKQSRDHCSTDRREQFP